MSLGGCGSGSWLQSSEGSTGLETAFQAHFDCCWLEASVLYHLGFSIGLLMTLQLTSSKTNCPRKRESSQDPCFSVLYKRISKMTCHHFCYSLYRVREDYMKLWIPRGRYHLGLFWRLAKPIKIIMSPSFYNYYDNYYDRICTFSPYQLLSILVFILH